MIAVTARLYPYPAPTSRSGVGPRSTSQPGHAHGPGTTSAMKSALKPSVDLLRSAAHRGQTPAGGQPHRNDLSKHHQVSGCAPISAEHRDAQMDDDPDQNGPLADNTDTTEGETKSWGANCLDNMEPVTRPVSAIGLTAAPTPWATTTQRWPSRPRTAPTVPGRVRLPDTHAEIHKRKDGHGLASR